ncbi:hypothetical protein [Asticcacaulis sp. 201]|uniref:hypothetical protein n=1 Tax=Asticcacaulis sp. 201 TaxID=3028787 RepID=UPI0029163DC5|nr:hypothetical protein [Asticcacaulis sp. 201]MDV6333241.1 hypothetical protein [Asticcacaulis sp. 201]
MSIDEGALAFAFGAADDVKAAKVESVEAAINLARTNWNATRATLNLSLLISTFSKTLKHPGARLDERLLYDLYTEFLEQIQKGPVLQLLMSNIVLQYIFFEENLHIFDQLEKTAVKIDRIFGAKAKPFRAFADCVISCERATSLAKAAKESIIPSNRKLSASLYRYLHQSNAMGALMWRMSRERQLLVYNDMPDIVDIASLNTQETISDCIIKQSVEPIDGIEKTTEQFINLALQLSRAMTKDAQQIEYLKQRRTENNDDVFEA